MLNMNIPPTKSGRLNASVVAVMAQAGMAINNTFHLNNAGAVAKASGPCQHGVASLVPTGPFDYIVTQEDLVYVDPQRGPSPSHRTPFILSVTCETVKNPPLPNG